jgi:hypothetical protein
MLYWPVAWEVEYTDEFGDWWNSLSSDEQDSIAVGVRLLEENGPALDYPHTSKVSTSRHGRMRELRVQHAGRPYRMFYCFDPRRAALLLIGGDKTGQDRFYEEMVPKADAIYDQHLKELAQEEARPHSKKTTG